MVQFRELLRLLVQNQVEFVVVGGVAATLHGVQEPTRDLDVCIRLSDENWARVAQLLKPINPRYAMTPDRRAFAPDALALRTLKNLYALTDLGRIDFLGEVPPLGSIDAVAMNAVSFTVDQQPLKIIHLNDLVTVKEFVRRPKDLEVAAQLRAIRDAASNTKNQG